MTTSSSSTQTKEFGRRTVRPALRHADVSVRATAFAPERGVRITAPGENTRAFFKPGAKAFVPAAAPKKGRSRLVVALAVTGGLMFGGAVAASKSHVGGDIARMVEPAISQIADHVGGLSSNAAAFASAVQEDLSSRAKAAVAPGADGPALGERLLASVSSALDEALAEARAQGDQFASLDAVATEEAVSAAAASATTLADGVKQSVSSAFGAARYVMVDGVVRFADGVASSVQGAASSVADAAVSAKDEIGAKIASFVDGQIAEGVASAGLMRDNLRPAFAQLSAYADEAARQLMRDLDRETRLADMERTGLVVDLPESSSAERTDERIRLSMADVVKAEQDRVIAAVAADEAKYAQMLVPGAKKATRMASAYSAPLPVMQASFTVESGGDVRIGGERIKPDVVSSIAHAAKITGRDPVYLAALASRESNFKPALTASMSSATGVFQFLKSTWLFALKTFGPAMGLGSVADSIETGKKGFKVSDPRRREAVLALRTDPLVSGVMASEMERADSRVLQSALGRKPTPGESYMAHFFGVGEAARFLVLAKNNPSAPAAEMFPKAAAANKSLFYNKDGTRRSFEQVATGFKSWFEGPRGGMNRMAAFPAAAAKVGADTRSAHAGDLLKGRVAGLPQQQRPAIKAVDSAKPAPAVHAAAAARTAAAAKVAVTAKPVAAKPAAARVAEAAKPVPAPLVQQASFTPSDQRLTPEEVTPKPPAATSAPEAASPPKTPVLGAIIRPAVPAVAAKPAGYQLGQGRITGYITNGKLGSWATSFGRSDIIKGFGGNFARLPADIQDHLKNASELDLAKLAPAARFMPKVMRDGFIKEGLTFTDAVAAQPARPAVRAAVVEPVAAKLEAVAAKPETAAPSRDASAAPVSPPSTTAPAAAPSADASEPAADPAAETPVDDVTPVQDLSAAPAPGVGDDPDLKAAAAAFVPEAARMRPLSPLAARAAQLVADQAAAIAAAARDERPFDGSFKSVTETATRMAKLDWDWPSPVVDRKPVQAEPAPRRRSDEQVRAEIKPFVEATYKKMLESRKSGLDQEVSRFRHTHLTEADVPSMRRR